MNLLFWGLTISLLGKILLAVGVLVAHHKIAHEHQIDAEVLRSFRMEFIVTGIGIGLIVFGYLLEIYFYHAASLLSCTGVECTTYLNAIFGG